MWLRKRKSVSGTTAKGRGRTSGNTRDGLTRSRLGSSLSFESLERRALLTAGPLNYSAAVASDITVQRVGADYEVVVASTVVASRPVVDTNAINITGSIGNDTLRLVSTALASGLPITFTGNSAADTLVLDDSANTSSVPYDLAGTTFTAGSTSVSFSGVNTINAAPTSGSLNIFQVESVASGISLNIAGNGTSGVNTIVVMGTLAGSNSLDGQLLGSADVSTVAGLIFGEDTGSPSYTVRNDSVTRVGTETSVVTYADLNLGMGVATSETAAVSVKSTAFGISTVVQSGAVTIGNNGRLDNIQPNLEVTGAISVTIDDHSTTAAVDYTITPDSVTRTYVGVPSPTILYHTDSLIVNAGSGSNTIDLGEGGDFGSMAVTLNTGNGSDTVNMNMIGLANVLVQTNGTSSNTNNINVQSTTSGTTTLTGGSGNDHYYIGAVDHNLDSVFDVDIDGGGGTNTLVVDDANGTSGTLNNTNPITRTGVGTTVSIAYANVGVPTLISGV
jgi:hypothetical protein